MASTGEAWRLGRRPGLDGVRGLAIALVLVGHLRIPGVSHTYGTIGVTVFFALSGFLITALLLEEHATSSGRIRLGAFYARRARRLLPALFVMVGVVMVASTLVPGLISSAPSSGVLAVTYLANWAMIPADTWDPLQHTWSLSVEEQFYIVWPLAVIALLGRGGRRWVLAAALAGALASAMLTFALWDDGLGFRRVYYGSDTRAAGLLVGCALAAALTGARCPWRTARWVAPVAVAALAALGTLPAAAVQLYGPLAAAVIGVVLVWAAATQAPGWLCGVVLRWLGRLSYGMYLWHYPLVRLTRDAEVSLLVSVPTVVGGTLTLAWLSWRFVEQPVLRGWRSAGDQRPTQDVVTA